MSLVDARRFLADVRKKRYDKDQEVVFFRSNLRRTRFWVASSDRYFFDRIFNEEPVVDTTSDDASMYNSDNEDEINDTLHEVDPEVLDLQRNLAFFRFSIMDDLGTALQSNDPKICV